MPLRVKLKDVVDALELTSDFHSHFLDRRTGEIEMITQEAWNAAENDELISDYPEWQSESIVKEKEIQSTDHSSNCRVKMTLIPMKLWNSFAMNTQTGESVRGCWTLLKAKVRFVDSKI